MKKKLQKECKKLWSKAVFDMWGRACLVCSSVATHPHHYIPKSCNGLLRYEVKNGIPLCPSCHWKIHFSPNPAEKHRIIEDIRMKRGAEWRDYIDEHEKIHGRSFNNIGWLEEQKTKLEAL